MTRSPSTSATADYGIDVLYVTPSASTSEIDLLSTDSITVQVRSDPDAGNGAAI